MCYVLLMIRCKLSWEAQLTEFDAAHVGGTPGLVAFDLVRVSLRDAVRRAVETGADHLAALGLLCLLYTSPSPRDQRGSRMPSSA